MNNIAQRLDEYLRSNNLPLEGVSIGLPGDRSTWRVDLAAGATDAQRTQAATLVQAFDPNSNLTADETDRAAATAAQVAAVLTQIAARQTQIDTERTAVASDITALAAATTLAQVKPIVTRLLQRQDNALTAEKRSLEVLDRVLRALRRLVS